MISRRFLLGASAALATGFISAPALAFDVLPYDKATADKLIASGKPVVLPVYASWCLQCHMQKSILESMQGDKTYDKITFFRVDYDGQKDVVKALDCPRSTLVVYKGGKEINRMSWGVTKESVVNSVNTAL